MTNWIRAVSCWGNEASPAEALALAHDWGFEAVEGPLRGAPGDWRDMWTNSGLRWIAEIATGCEPGAYVPSWHSTPAGHLEDFQRKLDLVLAAGATKVTVLAGSDAWEYGIARDFLGTLLERARGLDLTVETHRGRPTFHPLPTLRLLDDLPDLRLTLDLSHWCVTCARPMAAETSLIDRLPGRIGHIPARVGYDQGPQAPDPRPPWHRDDVESHFAAWHRIASGETSFTITPEAGPDRYLQCDPATGRPLADLREINRWVGTELTRRAGNEITGERKTV